MVPVLVWVVFLCGTFIEQGGGVHPGVFGCDVTQEVAHCGQHGRQSEATLLT